MKMLPLFSLASFSLIHSTLPVQAQAPVAEYCGIQVVAQSYGEGNDSVRPFQSFNDGVKLAFLIRQPAGGLIGFDEKAGTIATFTDDKGAKLFEAGSFKNGFGSFPSVSKDGKAAVFTIEGETAPAKTAVKVIAKGTVALKTASKKETLKPAPLKAAGTIPHGKQTITVKEIEKSGDDTTVNLTSEQSFDALVEIRWLDAAGKPLEADSNGSSTFGFGDKITYSRSYRITGTPSSVELVTWTDLKTTTVPFSATVAIGAAK